MPEEKDYQHPENKKLTQERKPELATPLEDVRAPMRELPYETAIVSSLASEKAKEILNQVNTPLTESSLEPTFKWKELFGPEIHPFLLKEIHETKKLGRGLSLVMSTVEVKYSDDLRTQKELPFGFIMMEKNEQEKRGGRAFILVDDESDLPHGEIQGKIHVPEEVLRKINIGLQARGRIPFPRELSNKALLAGGKKVKNAEFVDENAKFFTIVNFILSDGERVPYVCNRVGSDQSQGEQVVIRYEGTSDTKGRNYYGLVQQTRPILGRKMDETVRYFRALGVDEGTEFAAETGLDMKWGKVTDTHHIIQDPETDAITSSLKIFSINPQIGLGSETKAQILTEKEFEDLGYVLYIPEDIVEAVKTGYITEANTITGLVSTMIKHEELGYGPNYDPNKKVVFEERFLPQLGKTALVMPTVGIDKGEKIGSVDPDSGKSRISYQVNKGGVEILDPKAKYVALSIEEILERLDQCGFDVVTASSLSKSLFAEQILVAKGAK